MTQSSQPSIAANPHGEGVYKMLGQNGNVVGIPYSNVPQAMHTGYKLDSSDAPRFMKDYQAAAPGFLSSAYNATPLPLAVYAGSHPIKSALNVLDAGARLANPREARTRNMAYSPNPIVRTIGNIADSTADELSAGQEALHQGEYGAALSHGIQAIPGIGQVLTRTMDQTGGDTGSYADNLKQLLRNRGAMGSLTGMAATLALPARSAIYKYGGGPALSTVGEAMTPAAVPEAIGAVSQGITNGLNFAAKGAADRFLKGGKPYFLNGAEPGLAVQSAGPDTSFGFSKESLNKQIANAAANGKDTVARIVQNSKAFIPRSAVQGVVDGITPKSEFLKRAGGDLSVAGKLDDLRNSYIPHFGGPGEAMPAQELHGLVQDLDQHILRDRFTDPSTNDVVGARQMIRNGLADLLTRAEPRLDGPLQQSQGLSTAEQLMNDRLNDPSSNLVANTATAIGGGMAGGHLTTNPVGTLMGGAVGAALPEIAKSTALNSGVATGFSQAADLLPGTGKFLGNIGRATESVLPQLLPKSPVPRWNVVIPDHHDGNTNSPNDQYNSQEVPYGMPHSLRSPLGAPWPQEPTPRSIPSGAMGVGDTNYGSTYPVNNLFSPYRQSSRLGYGLASDKVSNYFSTLQPSVDDNDQRFQGPPIILKSLAPAAFPNSGTPKTNLYGWTE